MWIAIGIVAFLVVMFILMGNSLVASKNAVEKASSNIDVYLQQRLDLMENLFLEMERGLDHEATVYKEVSGLRSKLNVVKDGYDSSSASSIVKTDKATRGLLAEFNAVSEAYPQLQGVGMVQKVMDENSRVEREIVSARRSYNTNVTSYRNAIKMFPTSMIASMKGFTDEYELYQADEQARNRVKPMFEDHYKEKYKVNK